MNAPTDNETAVIEDMIVADLMLSDQASLDLALDEPYGLVRAIERQTVVEAVNEAGGDGPAALARAFGRFQIGGFKYWVFPLTLDMVGPAPGVPIPWAPLGGTA